MKNGIYAKPIREICDELDKETEQLFQTYDLVLDEMARIINKNMMILDGKNKIHKRGELEWKIGKEIVNQFM